MKTATAGMRAWTRRQLRQRKAARRAVKRSLKVKATKEEQIMV